MAFPTSALTASALRLVVAIQHVAMIASAVTSATTRGRSSLT
jgi:hypothetical protein